MLQLRRPVLGQLSNAPFYVVVTDPRGAPWEGARVQIQGVALPQTTDAKGVATFQSVPGGQVLANIQLGDYRLSAMGTSDSTLFVAAPVCAPGPILSNTEILALLAGAGLSAGGFYWKQDIAKMLGEVLVGASVFSALYRNSCRW